VSNNAEHTPEEVALELRTLGLDVPIGRIVLAGTLALELVAREMPRTRVMLLGSSSLHNFAVTLGLQLEDKHPDVVVVGRDRRFTYDRLRIAANAVRAGAVLVAANPDLTHPGAAGGIVPETGALLAAILACTGPMNYRVVGKPERALFLAGLEQLGCPPHEAVMIGDNADTDGRGAEQLGMPFIRVQPQIEQFLHSR
jgi:HAD superfamily hydrolase (TIGR01450 family)